jgi:hypothetical protein
MPVAHSVVARVVLYKESGAQSNVWRFVKDNVEMQTRLATKIRHWSKRQYLHIDFV